MRKKNEVESLNKALRAMGIVNLAIKFYNCASDRPCAICGHLMEPLTGPELYLADTWEMVCWDCGRKYGPVLVDILTAYESLQPHEGVSF